MHRNHESTSRDLLLFAGLGAGLFFTARSAIRESRRMDFRGRTVLITGGSRGLGLLMARRFAAEGANLSICARDEAELQRAKEDLSRFGVGVLSVRCDVGVPDDVQRLVRQTVERFGRIDVLVNNAGTISVGPMEVMTPADFDLAMRTHFHGPLHATLGALPIMRGQGEGRIVDISSIGGKIPAPHLLPYTASKFALTGFSEGLRVELLKERIYVTTVCPGLIRTGSPRNATFKGNHQAEYAWFSIADSLPITSMSAARAARKVVDACRYGQAELVLSVQAKLAVKFFQLFPGLALDFNGMVVNRLLPSAGPAGRGAAAGHESESAWSPSVLTTLTERAAVGNNEVGR